MRIILSLAALALAAGCTATGAAPQSTAQADMVPAAATTGTPTSCIHVNRIRQSLVRNDQVIDFKMANGNVYRNTLVSGCPMLGSEKRFGYKITNGQLCSGDVITVLQQGSSVPGPGCGLSQFQPVTLASAAN